MMGVDFIEIVKPGLFTTIQDLGREGWQRNGIVVAGAMDPLSLQIGNILVGNERNEAGLEVTLLGPEILFLDEGVIAICGGDLTPTLEGKPVPLWQTFRVKKGQVLRFGERRSGARAYIAIAGGIDIKPIFGSKSTYVKGRVGGLDGRALQKGDVLKRGGSSLQRSTNLFVGTALLKKYIPVYEKERTFRLIPGPEIDAFLESSITRFLTTPFVVTPQTDRMGYGLQGARLIHKKSADIISDAVTFGTIQVPANGQPIILMADRQTTGGYTRVANIITVDLPYMAQLLPGDKVSFKEVTIHEAQAIYRKQQKWMDFLEQERKEADYR